MHKTLFVIASAVACGGGGGTPGVDSPSSSPPNSVTGEVQGRAFAAKDAIEKSVSQTNGFSFDGPASFVEITDYAGACGLAGQGLAPTDSRILVLATAINDASGKATTPTGPGMFNVYPATMPLPRAANVAQVYYGTGCNKSIAYEGTSGTITITAVKPDGSLDGSFDVTISCAGYSSCAGPDAHLTGTFSSASCAALNPNHIPTCS